MNVKDQIIDKISSFPTLPTMANKLLGLLNDPDVSGSQISQIIQYDPALTANLMKAANSAYFINIRGVFPIGDEMDFSNVGIITDIFQPEKAGNRLRTFGRGFVASFGSGGVNVRYSLQTVELKRNRPHFYIRPVA